MNQIELLDDQVRGLRLRVYAGGARTWMLAYRRREDNRRRQVSLGPYPGVTLKKARQLAEVEIGRVATGEDPKGERDERRAGSVAATVAEVAELFLTGYAQEHKRPKSYAMDRWQLDAYVLPRWAMNSARPPAGPSGCSRARGNPART